MPGIDVNTALRDSVLRREIRARRFSKGLAAEIGRLLAKTERSLKGKIAARIARGKIGGARGGWTTEHMQSVLAEIRAELSAAKTVAQERATERLVSYGAQEGAFAANALEASFPIEIVAARPAEGLLRAIAREEPFAGRLMGEWFEDMERATYNRMRDSVRVGLLQGATIPQITREVADATGMMARHAATIVRTATNHIGNSARQDVYDANADILKGVLWVSTLDGRTSEICQALDGRLFPVDEGPRPPAHPNCRSVIVPVTKSWEELGFDQFPEEAPMSGERPFVADTRSVSDIPQAERDLLVGQVPSETNYQDWLRDQDRDFVEEVLGADKARLFLDERVPLDAFVDALGKPISLAELEDRSLRDLRKEKLFPQFERRRARR